MSKNFMIATAVIGVICVSGFAWAKAKGYCDNGEFTQYVAEWVSYKLDLNEEQNGKLQQLTDQLGLLRQDMATNRTRIGDEIKNLLAAPSLDRDRLMRLLDERHRARAEHRRELVNAFADFSDGLKPEQREQLSELIAKRLEHQPGPQRLVD